ncbi:hypothetical protein [Methylotetracoccus oryzae]|uniref:hypothetical protein n=1 Tax=Methylotetracoccus oryzae TaxID=1919059 RepID=UPI00111A6B4B|nr:hypothetical protein [Methylotetracoccus oryzae]
MNFIQSKPIAELRALMRAYPCLSGLSIAVPTLILVGDAVLPTLGHVLHLLIEVVEVPLEHLLEHLLHLSPRQAQGVLAWTALAGLIYLLIRFVQKTIAETRRATAATTEAFRSLKGNLGPTLRERPAATLTLTVGLLGAIAFMMF